MEYTSKLSLHRTNLRDIMVPSTKFKEEEILMSQKSLDFGDFVIEPVSGDIPHHKTLQAL